MSASHVKHGSIGRESQSILKRPASCSSLKFPQLKEMENSQSRIEQVHGLNPSLSNA